MIIHPSLILVYIVSKFNITSFHNAAAILTTKILNYNLHQYIHNRKITDNMVSHYSLVAFSATPRNAIRPGLSWDEN